MRVPSGLNATLDTASVWPVSGWPTGWPVSRVPQPHGVVVTAGGDPRAVGAERHADHRVRVAGQRLADRVGRCRASHSRTVLSSLPEAMRVPSGLNATLSPRPCGRSAAAPIGLAGVRVPQPHRVVVAAGGDARAVGAERHAGHRVRVAGQRLADRVGRWRRPTAARCRRHCRRRSACRRG